MLTEAEVKCDADWLSRNETENHRSMEQKE